MCGEQTTKSMNGQAWLRCAQTTKGEWTSMGRCAQTTKSMVGKQFC